MTSSEIIAEFMHYSQLGNVNLSNICNSEKECFLNGAMYHCSWDWLIPVLKKIDELLYASYVDDTVQDFFIKWSETNHEAIEYTNNHLMTCTDINEVYNDVIDFIIFYNKYTNEN